MNRSLPDVVTLRLRGADGRPRTFLVDGFIVLQEGVDPDLLFDLVRTRCFHIGATGPQGAADRLDALAGMLRAEVCGSLQWAIQAFYAAGQSKRAARDVLDAAGV